MGRAHCPQSHQTMWECSPRSAAQWGRTGSLERYQGHAQISVWHGAKKENSKLLKDAVCLFHQSDHANGTCIPTFNRKWCGHHSEAVVTDLR
jgi:hypothetical protein